MKITVKQTSKYGMTIIMDDVSNIDSNLIIDNPNEGLCFSKAIITPVPSLNRLVIEIQGPPMVTKDEDFGTFGDAMASHID